MRYVSYIVAIATLAVAGCADPYSPRYGNSQSYYSPSGYSYPANHNYPSNYNRSTAWGSLLQRNSPWAGPNLSLDAMPDARLLRLDARASIVMARKS